MRLAEQASELQISSEVIIPPANAIPFKLKERPIPISELDPLAAGCFPVCFAKGEAAAMLNHFTLGDRDMKR